MFIVSSYTLNNHWFIRPSMFQNIPSSETGMPNSQLAFIRVKDYFIWHSRMEITL